MDQLVEFAGNHWALVSLFLFLLAGLIFTEGKRGGAAVSTHEATRLINKEKAVVVDLRPPAEYKAGHIVDAVSVPYTTLSSKVSELEKHKDKPLILVCKMGQHSRAAGNVLQKAGFEQVKIMSGGITEWNSSSLPLVKA